MRPLGHCGLLPLYADEGCKPGHSGCKLRFHLGVQARIPPHLREGPLIGGGGAGGVTPGRRVKVRAVSGGWAAYCLATAFLVALHLLLGLIGVPQLLEQAAWCPGCSQQLGSGRHRPQRGSWLSSLSRGSPGGRRCCRASWGLRVGWASPSRGGNVMDREAWRKSSSPRGPFPAPPCGCAPGCHGAGSAEP